MSRGDWVDVILLLMILGVIFLLFWRSRKFRGYLKQQREREAEVELRWEKFIEDRRELYKSFADPERVQADLEASADLREMRDANRRTLPRDDAGPPAKVYRPPLRGVKPGSWRPRNPGSPSKQ